MHSFACRVCAAVATAIVRRVAGKSRKPYGLGFICAIDVQGEMLAG